MKVGSTPILQRGKVVPVFTLSDTVGHLVSRTSYRGRKHLALLFLADLSASAQYVYELASVVETVAAASGAILVITRENDRTALPDHTSGSLSFLNDPDGAVTSRFLPSDARNGLFITDRYGELYFQAFADTAQDLLPVTEIVSWIEAVDNQCSV